MNVWAWRYSPDMHIPHACQVKCTNKTLLLVAVVWSFSWLQDLEDSIASERCVGMLRGGGPSITFIFALWTLAVVKLLFNLFCLFIWCILSDKTPFASKASKEVKLPPGRRWNACTSYRHACTCVLGPPCYFFSFFFFSSFQPALFSDTVGTEQKQQYE